MWRASSRQLARRDAQVRVGIAGGVGEGRIFEPDLARALGQHGAERGLVAGDAFGERDAGIIGGIDDDALDAGRRPSPGCGSPQTWSSRATARRLCARRSR